MCGVTALGGTERAVCSWTHCHLLLYGNSGAALPLAKLTSGSEAMEVTDFQNVQCVLEAYTDQSHMLIILSGDVNHVRTWMFGIVHFRHSNIGSSDLSHWNCRPSWDCLCCPASVKLQKCALHVHIVCKVLL